VEKNIVEPDRQTDRPQSTIWRKRIACWITKVTDTHSECVMLMEFPIATMVTRKSLIVTYIHNYIFCLGARGGVVVKALRYKPVGRGFDSRWCHWNFSVT